MTPTHEALEERLLAPLTMQDIRLAVGEGKLQPRDVMAGCNVILNSRQRDILTPLLAELRAEIAERDARIKQLETDFYLDAIALSEIDQ